MSTLTTTKQALAALRTLQAQLAAQDATRTEPIAIVGMGCRYPGAAGLEAFWELLMRGGDAISDTPPARWDAEALHRGTAATPGSLVTTRGGFVDVEGFDPAFFGISPREAPHVDPRQRLMLEVTWEALEHAGLPTHRLAGSRTGVFVATLTNDYDHLLYEDLRRIDSYSGAGTADSVVANRISYLLDLKGPSLTLDTACSGSLVALHLACASLRTGESTAAIVGGVSVNLLPKSSVFFSRAGALSPSGRCATFDAGADGIVRSDGCGVVILKPLGRARADGDRIVAVIAGSAINHDGRSNGIMAPNGEAQAAVLAEAYRRAGIAPATVQYVETHGTGTRLGDPIEVQALGAVVGVNRPAAHPCVLGAAKTNIGHTEAAAGIAGVIKTALALRERALPPTIHFERPNPLLALEELPFVIRTAAGPWPSPAEPLVAGVSSFGFGGTNAHVVLIEAPPSSAAPLMAPPYVLPLSARAPEALIELATAMAALLRSGRLETGDICRTAATGRTHHPCRLAVVGYSAEELASALDGRAAKGTAAAPAPPRIAFVFSGQGSHWPQMGLDLYEREPVFRAALDECEAAIASLSGRSVLGAIRRDAADAALSDTEAAQPAIFAIQVAIAALWRAWGVTPECITGHSLGEIAAACASGALSVGDGARIVCARSALMKRVAGRGATAVVGLSLDDTRRQIASFDPRVTVAGSNGPQSTVVSGDAAEMPAVRRMFELLGVFCREVAGVDIAFHSAHMDPLRGELVSSLAEVKPRETGIPLVSTVTGDVIDGPSLGAGYWGRNLREPFLFTQAVRQLLSRGCTTLLEISPHAVLGSAMMQTVRQAAVQGARVLQSVRREDSGISSMYSTLAALYEAGQSVKWDAVCHGRGIPVGLPTYPWQRQRYWFDQLDSPRAPGADPAGIRGDHPLLGPRIDVAMDGDASEHLWQLDVSASSPAYIADHRINGVIVWPGAAAIEMAAAAAAQVWPGEDAELTDIRFVRLLQVPDSGAIELQAKIQRRGDAGEFQLFSRRTGAPSRVWDLNVSARLTRVCAGQDNGRRMDLTALHASCGQPVVMDVFYDALQEAGLEYGPSFRLLDEVSIGGQQSLAMLRRPPDAGAYRLHPAVLDGAFQAVAAALYTAGPQLSTSYLPEGVGRVRIHDGAGEVACVRVRLRECVDDQRLAADIELLAPSGDVCGEIEGLSLKRVERRRRAPDLLVDTWEEHAWRRDGPDRIERWLVLADRLGVGDRLSRELRARGHDVALVFEGAVPEDLGDTRFQVRPGAIEDLQKVLTTIGGCTRAVHLWSLSDASSEPAPDHALRLSVGALSLVQALALAASPPRLWLVTQGAVSVAGEDANPALGSIAGLAITTSREHPELACTHVDLEASSPDVTAAGVLRELTAADREPTVAWRQDRRYVARLTRAAEDHLGTAGALRQDATYAITGGLGALGLVTADALVQAGARHLLLVGRRGLDESEPAAVARVESLRATGASVSILAADVASPEIAGRLDEALRNRPPLAGLVHAAGVLADAPLLQQTRDTYARVFGAKAAGAWNLHLYTQAKSLDFFVCYSSAASMIGSPGQANYAAANAFVDALAVHRRAHGLPALAVNWGPWESSGMAANDRTRQRLSAHGISALTDSEGVAILRKLLATTGVARMGAISADWNLFVRQFANSPPPLFAHLAIGRPTAEVAPAPPLPAAPHDRASMLAGVIRAELGVVLGFRDTSSIGPRDGFFDIGLDSLTALEFRNGLQARLGVPLPATLAFDYGSLDLLVGFLSTVVGSPAAPTDAVDTVDALSDAELVAELTRELDREPA